MKRFGILLLSVIGANSLNAQVGIGNVVPDSSAILDLRNTNNRALLLPSIPGIPPATPTGLLYWDSALDKMLYLESGGYNALSPWRYKFNGSTSANTYFEGSGFVGLGLADPQRKLHIKQDAEGLALEGTSTFYIGFYPNTFSAGSKARLGFTSTSTTFYIQNQHSGANVEVALNNGGKLNVTGTNAKVQENGNDLLPKGSIIMWSGSTAPAGWALCDGNNGTPDLQGKFIVAYDPSEPDYNNPGSRSTGGANQGSEGGQAEITLTDDNMPEHDHTYSGEVSGGSHRHRIYWSDESSGGSPDGDMLWLENTNVSADGSLHTNNGNNDGSHTHEYSGTTDSSGESSPTSIDNRPPYYVLAFIMKL